MKIITLIFLVFSLVTGCTAEQKLQQEKFSSLQIKEKLSKKEKVKFLQLEKEFDKIAQYYAYRQDYSANNQKNYCKRLISIYIEIEKEAISVQKEKLSNRISNISSQICLTELQEATSQLKINRTATAWKYISDKLPLSGDALSLYLSISRNNKTHLTKSIKEDLKLYLKAIEADSSSLKAYQSFYYWYTDIFLNQKNKQELYRLMSREKIDKLLQEYCDKAVELKQWDHIYYLTDDYSIKPNCPKVFDLIRPYYPEEYNRRSYEP